ncbi:MAG: hypothetical protein EOL93_10115 [Epsilonproteobacteria bacterium]|nr:hypothetical protein [Campylobacterota bacterium]
MIHYLLGLFLALELYAGTHIVLLGDPHIPGKDIAHKEEVLETLNQWETVDMVVALGDVCSKTGSKEEYALVKSYFSKLKKPLFVITGNHDFIYDDMLGDNEKLRHASLEEQNEKLRRFRETFHLETLYYSLQKENYLLIFLSADDASHLAQISQKQLEWFEATLLEHKNMPTIVFFHAPLDNTLETYNRWANTPNFIAQPKTQLHHIIRHNPQLFLWVSGHTHTSPKEPSFASTINRYEQVTNIHNSDMNKETIWSNSLFLEESLVRIQTYNHRTKEWQKELERTIAIPKF